jgi:hypothetical protein
MEQLNELDIALHECTNVSNSLNEKIIEFNETQTEISQYMAKSITPFSLENRDGDIALEELIQKGKNLLSTIKNLIIKLWTNIKELVDKALHIFSGTVKKLKQYQAALKTKTAIDQAGFNVRINCYPKAIMIKRVTAIMNEINMRWSMANGSPNMAERKSLDEIGFHIRNDNGKVKASYNGAFPREDTIAGHGYQLVDIARLVDNAITMFDQFPNYKESMIRQFDSFIKERYNTVNSDAQKAQVILMDRVAYMSMHKTIQYILKSIREIGNQTVSICKAIGV